jgi:regulator of replication initiation timing
MNTSSNIQSKSLEEQFKDLQKQNEDLLQKLKYFECENLSLRLQLSRLQKVIEIPQRPNNKLDAINLCDHLGEK